MTDKIRVEIERRPFAAEALEAYADYIASQTLAVSVAAVDAPAGDTLVQSEIDEQPIAIAVTRV